jgi:putative ABC transport system permease protein
MLLTTIILALREIRRHVLRSVLTALGIVIGVGSVITMVTLGAGASIAIKDQISALGSNLIQIAPGKGSRAGSLQGRNGTAAPFKVSDVEAMREQIAGVLAIAGIAQASGVAVHNAQNWSTSISGVTDDYFTAQNWKLTSGRVFTPSEEQAGKAVCVIGATIARNIFLNEDPIGKTFRIKGVSCDAIGLLESRGQSGFGGDQDDIVLMPMKAVQRRFAGNQDVRAIMALVDPAFDNGGVRNAITALLRERRKITPSDDDDFLVIDTKQIVDAVAATTKILTALLGAVAALSLVVGGIGIMNIMLVSVTERTREIGIRLAIGATSEEVLLQFLVEAVVLACFGGVIGIVLALGLSLLVSAASDLPFTFNLPVNLISFLVSGLIGVVFGYVPARRAAALDPIEALRHE